MMKATVYESGVTPPPKKTHKSFGKGGHRRTCQRALKLCARVVHDQIVRSSVVLAGEASRSAIFNHQGVRISSRGDRQNVGCRRYCQNLAHERETRTESTHPDSRLVQQHERAPQSQPGTNEPLHQPDSSSLQSSPHPRDRSRTWQGELVRPRGRARPGGKGGTRSLRKQFVSQDRIEHHPRREIDRVRVGMRNGGRERNPEPDGKRANTRLAREEPTRRRASSDGAPE